jgi:formylmethanofuran dehydrogenase subunit E
MEDFETLLARSVQHHGHLCPGQIIGVRMAMLGCRLIGIEDPQKTSKTSLCLWKSIDAQPMPLRW